MGRYTARAGRDLHTAGVEHKRVAGIVFNFVNQDHAKKYGGHYYHAKSYEKYYSE